MAGCLLFDKKGTKENTREVSNWKKVLWICKHLELHISNIMLVKKRTSSEIFDLHVCRSGVKIQQPLWRAVYLSVKCWYEKKFKLHFSYLNAWEGDNCVKANSLEKNLQPILMLSRFLRFFIWLLKYWACKNSWNLATITIFSILNYQPSLQEFCKLLTDIYRT